MLENCQKNNPLTAFVFDLTGLMIIAGVVLAVLRRRLTGEAAINGPPDRDWWAVGLLGAIVIVGFILEGARIALYWVQPRSKLRLCGVGPQFPLAREFTD